MNSDEQAIKSASVESVAFGVQAVPGVYALLLGAGVSRSAGIPSAWDVTNDLCKKLAACSGNLNVVDGIGWYRNQFDETPTYSGLFDRLSTSGVERAGLLKRYFEATEVDSSVGLKLPTSAHRAIARLVNGGFFRVIVTTNFDPLLQSALGDIGVHPIVISSEIDAETKPPFVHNRCTILKIHGDYLDATFRNTTDELSQYPEALRRRLSQVISEYGLIVCGWSGSSDTALREALLDEASRRFSSLYWCARHGRVSERAADVLAARNGHSVPIDSADSFFETLADSVEALEQMQERSALSEIMAGERAKSYVTNPIQRAKLENLVVSEANKVVGRMNEIFENGLEGTGLAPLELLELLELETSTLRAIAAAGCAFDDGTHNDLWKRCIEILLPRRNASIAAEGVELYPALLLAYSIGVTSQIRSKHEIAKTLLVDTVWQYYSEQDVDHSIATLLYPSNVLDRTLSLDPAYQRMAWKTQSYLFLNSEKRKVLWRHAREFASSDTEFDRAFHSFEYLLGSSFLFQRGVNSRWAPPGAVLYSTRNLELPRVATMSLETITRLRSEGMVWEPVSIGMFNGSMQTCEEVFTAYNAILEKQRYLIL